VLVLGVVFPKPTLLALGILVAAACFVLFFPSRPEWFFYLVIVTSGLDYFGIIATSQTYNVTYFQFALLLAIASYVAYAAMNQQWDLPGTRASMPFLALWGMAAFSLLYCASWQDGVVLVIRILFLGILSFLTVLVVRTKPKMAQTVFFLLATAVVVSVMATYQLVMDKEFLPPELANQFGHGVNRAEGTFANANWMAAFVMIGPVLSLSSVVEEDDCRRGGGILRSWTLGVFLPKRVALYGHRDWLGAFSERQVQGLLEVHTFGPAIGAIALLDVSARRAVLFTPQVFS
jgi:hypothetical protein